MVLVTDEIGRELTIDMLTEFDPVEFSWRELSGNSTSIFTTFEWASTWWRHFGLERELRIGVCRRPDGTPFGIVPLYCVKKRPLRVFRFVGYGESDQLGPICAPNMRGTVGRLVRAWIRQRPSLRQVILAGPLADAEGWPTHLGAVVRASYPSYVADLGDEGWDGYARGLSGQLRAQLKRKRRRLGAAHEVIFRLSSNPSQVDTDMDVLFELHDRRWGELSNAFTPDRRAFHRDFAAIALRRGWLRLWVLEVDGRPAAAWHGFRFRGAESYYQAGRDPAFDQYSIGLLLLAHSIRAAAEDGAQEYRFLRGDALFKRRFATRVVQLQGLAVGNAFLQAGMRATQRAAGLAAGLRRSGGHAIDSRQ